MFQVNQAPHWPNAPEGLQRRFSTNPNEYVFPSQVVEYLEQLALAEATQRVFFDPGTIEGGWEAGPVEFGTGGNAAYGSAAGRCTVGGYVAGGTLNSGEIF